MGAETLHVVSEYLLEQLARGILGERENWTEFYRLNRLKGAILRGQGMDFTSSSRHPFNFTGDESGTVALHLIELYSRRRGISGSLKEWGFPLGSQHLGHHEAIRSMRELYICKNYSALELEFGFVLAQLAHLTYPTWTPGRIGLSFLFRMGWPVIDQVASNPTMMLPIDMKFRAHPIETQFSAGIYLDYSGVCHLYDALQGHELNSLTRLAGAKQIANSEIEQAISLLLEALGFAKECGHGLIEAAGILDEDTMLTSV